MNGCFMQITTSKEPTKNGFKIKDLTLEERSRFVGAFAWLIKQDKKQNPALYQIKRTKND